MLCNNVIFKKISNIEDGFCNNSVYAYALHM